MQRLRHAGTGCPIVIGGSAALWSETLSDVPGISIVGDLAAIVGTVETLMTSHAEGARHRAARITVGAAPPGAGARSSRRS